MSYIYILSFNEVTGNVLIRYSKLSRIVRTSVNIHRNTLLRRTQFNFSLLFIRIMALLHKAQSAWTNWRTQQCHSSHDRTNVFWRVYVTNSHSRPWNNIFRHGKHMLHQLYGNEQYSILSKLAFVHNLVIVRWYYKLLVDPEGQSE